MRFQRAKSRGLPFGVEIALAQVLGSSERMPAGLMPWTAGTAPAAPKQAFMRYILI